MSVPEHWFGPPPVLAEDEEWIAHLPANRSHRGRAIGGGLHVTTQRLMFTPRGLDAALGAKRWICALSQISRVGVAPRQSSLLELFSGGRRQRLRVDLRDGTSELFVVANPEERAAALRQWLRAQPVVELPVARVIEREKT